MEASILRVCNDDAGIICGIYDYTKPLWFSDISLSIARGNGYPIARDIINNLRRVDAGLPHQQIENDWSTNISRLVRSSLNGSGVGYGLASSRTKAIGEAVERFCGRSSLIKFKDRVIFGSFADLKTRLASVPFDKWLNGHSAPADGSAGRLPFQVDLPTEADPMSWLALPAYPSGDAYLCPASLASLRSIRIRDSEPQITEQMSTGLACHTSLEKAVLSGLCEAIERDAFTGMWMKRLAPYRLKLASVANASSTVRKMLFEFGRTNLTVHLNDLTSDFEVPVILATITGNSPPYVTMGAGCHPDVAVAIEKSLAECLMGLAGYSIFNGLKEGKSDASVCKALVEHPETIASMGEHGDVYRQLDLRHELEFFLGADETEFDPGNYMLAERNGLDEICARCEKKGYPVIVSDLTVPEVRESEMSVVKVIVPGLIPLYCREYNKPVKNERLVDYASGKIFPRSGHSLSDDVNPVIHPFP
jgi:bacteriocin biosynthesis docking scaffold, SagD family